MNTGQELRHRHRRPSNPRTHSQHATSCRTSSAQSSPTSSRTLPPALDTGLGRQRPERSRLQLRFQLTEQPGNPVLLDGGQGGLVDARSAVVAAHLAPRPLQDVPAADLVIQRVESSSGIGLGRPVERMLQGTDRAERALGTSGGTSHDGTHRPLLANLRVDEAAALPITGGYVVRPARPVLRPPPTPSRPAAHFPARTGYRAPRSGAVPQSPGRGRPPQFPPPPSERSTPSTPGSSSRLRSRFFTVSMAFALRDGARLSLLPLIAGTFTARQASLHAADRSVASPNGALDTGLRPGPFPRQAASLLPGSLAITRTGLPPAGGDELTAESDHVMIPPSLWAHSRPS